MNAKTSVFDNQLEGVLISKLGLNVKLRVIGEMEMARLIVQILHFLLCVHKKDYRLEKEIKKENLIRSSVEKRQEERKTKERNSLDEIQYL